MCTSTSLHPSMTFEPKALSSLKRKGADEEELIQDRLLSIKLHIVHDPLPWLPFINTGSIQHQAQHAPSLRVVVGDL